MGKYTNIDAHNCSIEELEREIEKMKDTVNYFNNNQLATKIWLNSVYGGLANQYSEVYNVALAEAITLQGQHIIHFSSKVFDNYFKNVFHTQTELHKKLGIDLELASKPLNFNTLQVYGDTDSCYFSLDLLIKRFNIPDDKAAKFIVDIQKYGLESYLENCYDEYAKRFQCHENLQVFEMEKIARTCIMQKKKKYIMDIAWKEPNIFLEPLHDVLYKGIEVIQGSTPKFIRESIKDFIELILKSYSSTNSDKITYENLINRVKEYKSKYLMQDPNDICLTRKLNEYEKHILKDKPELSVNKGCPLHTRGAGIYNNLLYTKQKKYKSKYQIAKSGDKVKYYYTKLPEPLDVFAYLPGSYPIEFAPPMDYDMEFAKNVIAPINRIVEILGYSPIPDSLIFSKALW